MKGLCYSYRMKRLCFSCSVTRVFLLQYDMFVFLLKYDVFVFLLRYDMCLCFCCSMRQDVFDNLLAAQKSFGDSLQGEAKRYLERLIKLGKRDGNCYALS